MKSIETMTPDEARRLWLERYGYETRLCEGVEGRPCGRQYEHRRGEILGCRPCSMRERELRDQARHRRLRAGRRAGRAMARSCVECGGPLWPGEVPTRARSDKVTCSDRCRQARHRSHR